MAAPAPATGKEKRKRPLSEDDVYLLLHRYAPATILTALQEVAQHAEGRHIDWKALVGKSATGITSAREYQMLWRHFAYQHDLAERVDAGSSPLGDDSDLECELEPVPNPSKEALSEASSLAKMLISGSSREQASGHRVNLEVPTQNSPNEKIVRVPSDKQVAQSQRLTNIMGHVSNLKQPSQTGPCHDPLDANGASKKKKKIKTWSKEDDADLAAGVQKYGEGNWDIILDKCNLRTTRTSDQLSQRWALISKRPGSSKPATARQASIASSEERMATRKALSMAVDYNPCTRKSSPLRSGPQFSSQHASTVFGTTVPEVKSAAPRQAPLPVPVPVQMHAPVTMPLPVTVQVQAPLQQGQQAPGQAPPPKAPNASNKTRSNSKKQTVPQNPIVSSSIQAAAIAAGGRIATPIAAANHLKATQSKNAVRIRTRVTVSSKTSTSSKGPNSVVEPRTQLGGAEHLEFPNTVATISAPSILSTHATQQILDVSEVSAANPPGASSGAYFVDTKNALSASAVPASCNSEEQDDDSTFCIVTMDDLFPEDANQPESVNPKEKKPEAISSKERQQDSVDLKEKQQGALGPNTKQPDTINLKVEGIVGSKDADMLEFDQYVASQGGVSVNMDYPDTNSTVRSAPTTQGSAGNQKKQLKSVPTAGRSNSVCAGTSTSGKKTKTQVPHPVTLTPTGTPRVNVSAPSTTQNKTVVRKAAASATAGGQNHLIKKQSQNTKGNQTPNSVAGGVTSAVPGSSPASTVVNAAGKVNPPGSSPASTVVNVAGKVSPPGSSQASAVVNAAGKVNPLGSRLARTGIIAPGKVNPSGRSPASTVVIAPGKVNPPGNSQASTTVNGASKANPAGSSQTSTVVNGASKVNPLGSSQASKVVSGVSRANPRASQ